MKYSKYIAALVTTTTLLSIATPVNAHAQEGQLNDVPNVEQIQKDLKKTNLDAVIKVDEDKEGFKTNIDTENPSHVSVQYDNNNGLDSIKADIDIEVNINGEKVPFTKDNTASSQVSQKDKTITTMITEIEDILITREFKTKDDKTEISTEVKNLSDNQLDIAVSITDKLVGSDSVYSPNSKDGVVTSGGKQYVYQSDNEKSSSQSIVSPGKELKAEHSSYTRAFELQDTDKDGFPDEWEKHGFTDENDNYFPLHKWGADPNTPDIFLQLNWMKPIGNRDFTPSKTGLNRMVRLFRNHGYNLHIDGGSYYTNIPNFHNAQGGSTVPYRRYYYDAEHPDPFDSQTEELVGKRAAIFRSGVIGDLVEENSIYTVGRGYVNSSGFFASKPSNRLRDTRELTYTILHEFGHNLGLTHYGVYTNPVPEDFNKDIVYPNYKSVMNYLYGNRIFNYSEHTITDTVNKPLQCHFVNLTCYSGSYDIPADWDNLILANGEIGISRGFTGEKYLPEDEPERDPHDPISPEIPENPVKEPTPPTRQPVDPRVITVGIIAGSLGILGAAAVFVELQKKWNNR